MIPLSYCTTGFWGRFTFGDPRVCGTEYFGFAALAHAIERTRDKRTLILVPGYNSPEKEAIAAGLTIEHNLSIAGLLGPDAPYQEIIIITWPGRSKPGFWLAENAAKAMGDRLRHLIRLLECEALDIQTHSLGALVWCHANRKAELAGAVRNVLLTNAAIDDEAIEIGKSYEKAMAVMGKVLVAHSRKDPVLAKAYRWFGSLLRNPFGGDRALGFSGPEHPDRCPPSVVPWDATNFCESHGGMRNSLAYYERWKELLG